MEVLHMGDYKVYIDDNFHSPDLDSPRFAHAEFDDYDAAVVACRRIVDAWLADALRHNPGLSVDELRMQFAMFGDEPYISPAPDQGGFSAREYVAQRSAEICGK